MNDPVSALTPRDEAAFAKMRGWVRDMVQPDHRADFDDDPDFKIAIISQIFEENDFLSENYWELRALGVVFGDALAAITGTHWVVALIEGNRVPVLHWAPTDMRVGAFLTFEKRIVEGEKIEVVELFLAFCDHIERLKTPDGPH